MLRIVDANLNRLGEGLRLLEDISRFFLNDQVLSQQLKELRHELLPEVPGFQDELIRARKSEEDVGAFLEVDTEGARTDVVSLVRANAHRVQQSLRVLEEMGKLSDHGSGLDWDKLKHARFTVYELEQRIVLKLLRHEKVQRIAGLYVIMDGQALRGRSETEVARQAIQGGARVIQLRDKTRPKGELLPIAQELRVVCAESDALFIVNDHLDLALAADADGLHIGREDLPLAAARRLLPGDKVVGSSAATLAEALQAREQGADYIAVGSIYPSPSKSGTRHAGLDILRQVSNEVSVPVVAVGGINEHNIADVMRAGADAVAVISAVLGSDDVKEASRRLTARIQEAEEAA